MKRFSLLLTAFCLTASLLSANDTNPKADPKAEVVCGNARFTVLTDRLIRMEWSEDGKFEDRASLAIINRRLDVPAFTVSRKAESVTVKTSALTLNYSGKGKFAQDNLSVSFRLNGKTVKWTPGTASTGNLKGTTRTLDEIEGLVKPGVLNRWSRSSRTNLDLELEDGIISRDGWAIVDESKRHLLEKNDSDWGEWVVERPEGDRQDLYIFAYGHDYTAALADFTKVAGRIPLPPKYTFGYWWSRYFAYTDDQLLEIANELRSHEVPADVFIVDMDWHLTWHEMEKRKGRDEFGEGRGWTGYSWNHDLIPDPEGFLKELHSLGYKTSLNLHPASGIRPYEDCYEAFREDYLSRAGEDYDGPKEYVYGEEQYKYQGVDKPAGKPGYNAPVPFRMSQQAWADAYFNSVIHPLEKQGVDFWWLDWQQWMESRYVKDLSNTFWLNWTFFNDKVRQSAYKGKEADRPFIYHRWGGLGSHRYQLGFSGDTFDEWSALAMLPYFTSTASNVGYGYWGHDIGGHMQKSYHDANPEMYTRWLQYGVFTPIFKTHSSPSPSQERKIWAYPTHYEYMKEAIRLRYSLTPYIYDAARQAFDTGVSICRPLYYYYPEEQKAYDCHEEYFFGDNILATVLCQPLDPETGKTERKMWFPSGNDWYDMAHHCMHKGGSVKTLYYAIDENPWYVRSGAIVPLASEDICNLQQQDNRLRLLIVPGSSRASYTHYEDDGVSQAYDTDYATTLIEKSVKGKTLRVVINPRQGSYHSAPATRLYSIVLEGMAASSVKVDGQICEFENKDTAALISLPETSADSKTIVEIVLK